MFKLYDKQSKLMTPSGIAIGPEEMKDDFMMGVLLTEPCMIEINDEGVFTFFLRIEQVKNMLDTDETDPETLIEMYEASMASTQPSEDEVPSEDDYDFSE